MIEIISLIIRLLMGTIFIVSGFTKLLALDKFIITLYQFQLIPNYFIPYFGIFFPIIEFIFGFFLLLGFYVRKVAIGLQFLIITFIFAISVNLIRGNIIECGCFGNIIVEQIGYKVLARDILFFCLLIVISKQKEFLFALQNYQKHNFNNFKNHKKRV